MTAVLHSPTLFYDRPARLGERVHCGQVGSWLSLIGRVVDERDELTGRMRIEEEQTGTLVYVQAETARPFVSVRCPRCAAPLPGALATCRELACLRKDLDAEMAHVRREDD